MRKDEFIELIQISLNGGTPPVDASGKFHDVVIEKHIGMAYNEIVSQIKDGSILDQFCVIYRNQAILEDTNFDLRYLQINVGLLNTLQGSAVRAILPTKDQTANIFIRANHAQGAYKHLETTYYFAKNGTARVEADRIYFDNVAGDITEVTLKILPSFENIADSDEFEMPGGKDGMVFKMTMDYLQILSQTTEAYKNDNNANTK